MDLKNAFDEAVGKASPELQPLVAGALRQGTAIRRRRTAGMAGAVAAVVAVAVGGTLMSAPGGGGAAAAPAAGSASGSALVSSSTATEQVALTGPAAVKNLIGLLPAGMKVDTYTGRDLQPGSTPPEIRAEVTYRVGEGSTRIGAAVMPDFKGTRKATVDEVYDCAWRGPVVCTSTTRPDGSRLLVQESARNGKVERAVDLLRADGVRVSAWTSSLADPTSEQVLGQPPLTQDQLTAMVQSPAWAVQITTEQAAQAAAEIQPYTDGSATLAPTAP
jgi:hypothetical protein